MHLVDRHVVETSPHALIAVRGLAIQSRNAECVLLSVPIAVSIPSATSVVVSHALHVQKIHANLVARIQFVSVLVLFLVRISHVERDAKILYPAGTVVLLFAARSVHQRYTVRFAAMKT